MWHEGGRYAGLLPAEFPVQPGQAHETFEAKRRLKSLLDVSALAEHLHAIRPREATRDELLRAHGPDYLDRLERANGEYAAIVGLDAPMTRGSYDIARLAAGGCLAAIDAIMSGAVDNAYALVRPVGHHAEPDTGKGFCLLSNAALAAAHALAIHGVERIAMIDIDVHHGNGAQAIFWRDPRVLTISLHQEFYFPPDSGAREERGGGEGFGANLNIPLPAGCGWGAYEAAFARVVLPALRRFAPELIIVPCGFDAGAQDPLGRMWLHGEAYRAMTLQLMAAADESAQGRMLLTQEGGYNPWTVPFMGVAVFEALTGRDSGIVDPMRDIFVNMHGHALLPHQEAAIDAAAALVGDVPAPRQA